MLYQSAWLPCGSGHTPASRCLHWWQTQPAPHALYRRAVEEVASQERTQHRLEHFVESVEDEGNLAAELVTDDVVVLQAGDSISAALRLLRCLHSR